MERLVFFSPQHWYQVSFALLMIALAAGMYLMLAHYKSRDAPLVPWFYPVTTLRNFILFGFVLAMLISCSRRQLASASAVKKVV